MITITALTSGLNVPSSRFRVRQYINPLSQFGIIVTEYPLIIRKYTPTRVSPIANGINAAKCFARLPGLLASKRSNLTWLERELIPGKSSLEKQAGNKRVFDVDDAIWLTAPGFSEDIAQNCDGLIVGNSFLADHYRRTARRVWIIPTSVDCNVWCPRVFKQRPIWTIGWIGSSSNLKYLTAIEDSLAAFLSANVDTELLVVSDRRPSLKRLPRRALRFVRWSINNEVRLVQEMDVGLMPLPDTEWTRGKCALKLLLYLAVGIPVIASPVGVGAEILDKSKVGFSAKYNSDWYNALERLFRDREQSLQFGENGRRLVEEDYSVEANLLRLAMIFHEINNT